MRDLISNVGTDYVAFSVTAVLVLIVTLIYLWWVCPLKGNSGLSNYFFKIDINLR